MMFRRWKLARALGCGALLAVLAGGCTKDPEIVERRLVVYSPNSCPIEQSEAFSVIYGDGDFEGDSAVASFYLREIDKMLDELPAQTRSVIVDVSNAARSKDWRGTAEVPPSGAINVLAWPDRETCRLTRNVEPRVDTTLGVFGRHIMIAGGSIAGKVPRTFVGDLSTGILEPLEFGLATRRSRASITAFRTSRSQDPSPALVAGGEDPDTQSALATAEIYVPSPGALGDLGDFARERIDLAEARTRHGAVVLATGETLLVGGVGQFGQPLGTLEIVDPVTRRSRTNDSALLKVPRSNPTVLRLASGEIMVAGGFNRSNERVPTIEWFSADAKVATFTPRDLVPGRERSFIALEGGGALAVVVPEAGATDIQTVWVISAQGTIEPGTPIDPAILDRSRLFQGTEGAPVLWTGQRWLRWQPWFAAFQPIPDAPDPSLYPAPSVPGIANGDNGLALWLDDTVPNQLFVRGYRFGTRSRFGAVPPHLLIEGTSGLAPDRIAGTPGSAIRFDPVSGLELGLGASAFVTDVTYADVSIELASSSAALVLREETGRELTVGGAECPFAVPPVLSLRVKRVGRQVQYSIDGADLRTCRTELSDAARVAIGVRGTNNSGSSFARDLRITRR